MVIDPGILIGAVIFLVTNVALVLGAHRLSSRLTAPAANRARLLATGVIALYAIVLLAQILSWFHLYTRAGIMAGSLALLVAARTVVGPGPGLGPDLVAVRDAATAAARSRGAVMLLLGLAALLVAGHRAATLPPLGWDSILYHLTFAARFVQTGSLVTMDAPFAMDRYDHFPKNGEIVAAWLMLPFHGDLLVGFMNIGLLSLGWLAAYNVAREIDLEPGDAALGATAVCTSPLLFGFVTTQNPDALVFAMLMSTVAFTLRFRRQARPEDAWLACLAAGVAFGTKYTAVPMAALLLSTLGVTAVVRATPGRAARLAAGLALGALLVGAAGARQYVLNLATTGNPVYPMTIGTRFGPLSTGSPFTDQQYEEKGRGDRRVDLVQFIETLNYYPDWRRATSAGPKYLLLIPLALVALASRRSRPDVRLLVTFAIVGLGVVYAPDDGFAALSRRFWPSSAPRFMAIYFGVLALTGLSVLTWLRPRRADLLRALLVGFVVWDLAEADTATEALFPLLAGGSACALLLFGGLDLRRRSLQPLATAGLAVILVGGITILDARRTQTRWMHYAGSTDVHPIPRDFVRGWQALDRPGRHETVALTAGWADAGENWFFFPLMGHRLQNTVTYVPIAAGVPLGSRDFVRREHGREADWLEGIRARHVSVVFEQAPWPAEDGWMQAHPDRFTLRTSGAGFRIYDVRPDS